MIDDLAVSPQPYAGGLKCDVCIVGAGPAGISLALTLARLRPEWRVVLLEAGGRDNASERERDIYRVSQSGRDYSVLDISRRRKLGGTTAHWGGWSKPLDDSDFETNPSWDMPAWPIGPADLKAYYQRACDWCELGGSDFEAEAVAGRFPGAMLEYGDLQGIGQRLFRFSPPTRFGARYAPELEAQDNLTCLLHANLLQLVRAQGKLVEAVVAPLDGDTLRIAADRFVLAMGGMETTRQLLHLRERDVDDGEGVYSPHLGRYFADHFGFSPARLLAPAGLKYHMFTESQERLMPVLTFSNEALRGEGQNNACMRLYANAPDPLLSPAYAEHAAFGFRPGEYWQYDVKMTVEPRPHRDSRLALTNERCELGLRRLHLTWKIDERDFTSAYQLLDRLGQACSVAGLGRLQITRENSPELRANVSGGCHHMGTTRMAARVGDGVVDPDLRVFDLENLYIASSSVFPRYGYSNPTLTIVALSLRLAEHLAGVSAGGRP
ncbi:GMC oxidoreductase [Parahaliea mediterranea]|uniref:GMC family oxidoreductase n=1 Tax=Parahaliea mediterranea TaxID=651086 RepID=A0A939DBG0_9GAMM|nr:GMC family oxidoreductase [Parahaliea mediterranea]MBN7795178.1 GMC family oxidoreductase [Parahaliea mediterranea]